MRSGHKDKVLTVETINEATVQLSRQSRSTCSFSPVICILSVSLLFVTVALLVVTAFHSHNTQESNKMMAKLEQHSATCSSTQCLRVSRKTSSIFRWLFVHWWFLCQISAEILTNMNQDVDPCDDAYTFGCGGYESGKYLGFNGLARDRIRDIGKLMEQRFNEIFMYAKVF